MKPGDFFIGFRQLLGILIPGSIWLAAIYLGALNKNPLTDLSQAGWMTGIALAGAIYILGYAMRRRSFIIGVRLSEKIAGKRSKKTDSSRTLHKGKETEHSSLIECAKETIESLSQNKNTVYSDKYILPMAKFYVLGEAELSRRVEEIEAEINLYATMVLPLFALGIAFLVYNARNNGVGFLTEPSTVMIIIVWFYIMGSFMTRIESRRYTERTDVLLMFLVMADLRNKK